MGPVKALRKFLPVKNAARPLLRRLLALHGMLSRGEYPNAPSVARELEVSQRTVLRDLEFMRDSLHAPLVFCRRRNGYHYSEPGYELPLLRLTQGELMALFLAEGVLRQCQGTPFEADLRQAVEKLVAALPDEVGVTPSSVVAALSVTPTVVTPHDVAVFAALAEAVAGRERLELAYWTPDRDEVTTRRVDPYHPDAARRRLVPDRLLSPAG
jgi:predicted DNA-binding transcriptional regulator YafY